MAELIRMPRMSDTMTEGVIVEWHKKIGDSIKPGDLLAEVETDKATMELESYNEGTLLYIGTEKGQSIKVNAVLAVVGKEGEDFKALLDESSVPSPKKTTGKSSKQNTEEKPMEKTEEKNKEEENKNNAGTEPEQKQEQNTEQKDVEENEPEEKQVKEGGEKKDVEKEPEASKVALPDGAKEIRMPLLSDTMTEGKIIAWNKNVGDEVKADDVLADVETDKATMEVVGYEEGTLLYIGVEAGKAAKINEIIAIVGKAGTDVSEYVKAEKAQQTTDDSPQTTDDSPQVLDGKEKTTDKNQQTTETRALTEIASSPLSGEPGEVEKQGNSNERIKASPLAKKMAEDKGVDISKINGSGDGGRIIKKDVDGYKSGDNRQQTKDDRQKTTDDQGQTTEGKQLTRSGVPEGAESFTDIPLSQMRKTIARRLSESNFTAPHFFLTMAINMDNAIASRTTMNEVSTAKISFNDMILKACAMALRLHPAINSSWISASPRTEGGDFIRQNNHINIGSAIALPEGLIVPVIRNADNLSLSQIATVAKDLYDKARNKKIQPEDFTGNTFTVSNLGMMDIEEFTAIINPPDSAILAVGKISEIVVKKGDGFGTTNIMKVTLSCDHRSVDGATGAAFLQTLKKFLENPVTMLV